ncbi:MAG: glycosyltransferase family 1 protein [Pseudomonadota bacterium]
MSRVVLDITRSISRLGRGPATGIDRVEAELFTEVTAKWPDALLSVSLGQRFFLLTPDAARKLLASAFPSDWWGRRQIEWQIARHAIARGALMDAGRLAANAGASVWVNVGHTGLERTLLKSLGENGISRCVMVHDVIPLDHPDWSRPTPTQRFVERMQAVSAQANVVIYPSSASQKAAERWFTTWGRVPEGHVLAHGATREFKTPARPIPNHFLAIGTVEPRKGYDLLCEMWESPATQPNHLTIIGQKGWAETALYDWINALERVTWLQNATDQQLEEALLSCSALLFPSRAEGAGLPVAEALQAGVPVIASDLPVLRELYGDTLTYVATPSVEAWRTALNTVSQNRHNPPVPPRFSWRSHLDLIEREMRRS